MPFKRKNRGRAKGGKGHSDLVQCSQCGGLVPRDKAKKVTASYSFVDPQLGKELRAQGAIISTARTMKYYCISCAIHRRVVKVRAGAERKSRFT
jgi:small subunit ribosomal protein S26e